MNRLEKILRPGSVAVIGASRKAGSLGKMFLDALLRMPYSGKIYPVNPNAKEISGLVCYASLTEIPEIPDLAVILLPQPLVPEAMREIGEKKIGNCIVVSAGFRETGPAGALREAELAALAADKGINLLGPNCMGIFNTAEDICFNGNFSPTLPNPGHVGFISQSGALGVAVMELAAGSDLGFSVFVSTGNKADIKDHDVIDFLREDGNTDVITLYLESIDNPEAFRQVCRRTVPIKPVLAVKAGRTESGTRAASSHTGALANPEFIMDGFLEQCGVIRLETIEQLFDAARALAAQPLPKGGKVAVLTNAGGPAILASDALEKSGLTLAGLKESTVQRLRGFLPAEAAVHNPVDMIASASHETYFQAMDAVLNDENVDAVLLIIVQPPVNTTPLEIINRLSPIIASCGKPVLPVLMAQSDSRAGLEVFKELHLPVYRYPETAARAMGTLWRYAQVQQRFRKSEAVVLHPENESALKAEEGVLSQAPLIQLLELLRHYDIPAAPYVLAENPEQVISFQSAIGGPVVLKLANEQIIHKSEAGLVKLNLTSPAAIEKAFNEITLAAKTELPAGLSPVLIAQKQVAKGTEIVFGGKRDTQFGPVVMVGIGGVFVEVLKDVVFRVAPVNAYEAREMLSALHSQAVLDGFRGLPAVNRERLAYSLTRFSLLLAEHPEIVEMDLNPLIWSAEENELFVVDIRATIQNG